MVERPLPSFSNDDHVPTRPGWAVYIGLVVVIVGVVAIMLSNKLLSPDKVGFDGLPQSGWSGGDVSLRLGAVPA